MIWITIVIILSTLVGIFAERRWPDRAGIGSRKSLLILLYVVLPPVIFDCGAPAEVATPGGRGHDLLLDPVEYDLPRLPNGPDSDGRSSAQPGGDL